MQRPRLASCRLLLLATPLLSQHGPAAGTVESIKRLVDDLNEVPVPNDVEVVVAPNFIHLYQVLQSLRPEIAVAAQNCWSTHMGAYTGEASPCPRCAASVGGVHSRCSDASARPACRWRPRSCWTWAASG